MTLTPIFPDIPDIVYLVMTLSPIFQSQEMPEPPDATEPAEEFTEDFGDPEAEADTGKH